MGVLTSIGTYPTHVYKTTFKTAMEGYLYGFY